jgi:hypothetical protein
MQDLESLLVRLLEAEYEFVLVGGFAAVAHGASLMTQDVDVCASMSLENLDRLARAVEGLGPVHRMRPDRLPFDVEQAKQLEVKNLYLSTDLGQLDCLGEIAGLGEYEAVRKHIDRVPFRGHELRILSLDALIVAKSALDRPRDKEAVLQLKAIRDRLRDA